jgi:sulfite reductase alpha subunit-like flavoprotein
MVPHVLPHSRSTIFVRLHTNGNQELQYQPGDHLGVFPGNHEDLVNALIERLEDAPPANQTVKVELLEERNTALGNALRDPAIPDDPEVVGVRGKETPSFSCSLV